MKLIKIIGSLFIMGLFLIPSQMKATHIVGGELTYRCLAKWTFEVTLTLRRDCEFGSDEAQFDDPASVGIYDSNGELLWWLGQGGQLSIPFNQDDTLNNEFVAGCDFLGDGVCVHTSTYVDTITLPFRPGGYILAYSRCCRNETLTNISDPLETGTTYSVHLTNTATIECNDSPTFDEPPALYICAGEELVGDMSATDSDGDSLVYRLCVPLDGASPENPQPQPPRGSLKDEVNFVEGFGVDNFLGGPDPLVIDPETGIITGTPNLVGQFLVGICVEEYRNGELIGSIRRDFEYNVRECIAGPDASFTVENEPQCDGLEVEFTNTSEEVDTYEWFFDFPNEDPAFKSTEENPTFTYPEEGFYTIKLIATRTADGCTSEFTKELGVFDSEIEANFNNFLTNACMDDSIDVTFVSNSVEPNPNFEIASYLWTISGEGYDTTGTGEEFRIVLPTVDSLSVTLLVTSETGCTDELTQVVNTNDNGLFGSFDPNYEVISCEEDSITIILTSTSSSNNPDIPLTTIDWLFEFDNFSETASGEVVTITLPREDSVKVTLSVAADNGCSATDMLNLDAQSIDDEDIEFLSDTILVCPGDTTFLLASPNPDLTYTWTPTEGLIFDGDDTSNPQYTFPEGVTMAMFELTVSDTICGRDAGKVVILEDMGASPQLSFETMPMCGTTMVCFINTSTPEDGNYEFDFGDEGGAIDTIDGMICYEYPDFGLYSVTLNSLSGCGDFNFSRTIIVPEDVSVSVAEDTIRYCTGEEVSLEVNIETDGTIVEWLNEDGDVISTDDAFTYVPEGEELITVIGFNAGGCFDTAMIQLIEDRFEISIDGPEIGCAGDDAIISVTDNTDGNLSFIWTPEDGIVGSNTGSEITVNVTEDTEFFVTITNDDSGCTLDTSFVLMISTVSAEIEADPAEVFQCNVTELSLVDQNPDWTYEWSTGETTGDITTDTLLSSTSFSVTVTDENGCTAEASIDINVLEPQCDETDVFLPTAFSPNGDGVNDVLRVESNFVKSLDLRVYNRWGELVFSTTNIDEGWDGTYNGAELAPDVYVFTMMATCSNGQDFNSEGNVSLIR